MFFHTRRWLKSEISRLEERLKDRDKQIESLHKDIEQKSKDILLRDDKISDLEFVVQQAEAERRRSAFIEKVNLPPCKSEVRKTCEHAFWHTDERGEYVVGCAKDKPCDGFAKKEKEPAPLTKDTHAERRCLSPPRRGRDGVTTTATHRIPRGSGVCQERRKMKIKIDLFGRGSVEYEREPMKQERFAAIMNAVYIALGGGVGLIFFALFFGALGGQDMARENKLTFEFIGEPNWLKFFTAFHEAEAAHAGRTVDKDSVHVLLTDGREFGRRSNDAS